MSNVPTRPESNSGLYRLDALVIFPYASMISSQVTDRSKNLYLNDAEDAAVHENSPPTVVPGNANATYGINPCFSVSLNRWFICTFGSTKANLFTMFISSMLCRSPLCITARGLAAECIECEVAPLYTQKDRLALWKASTFWMSADGESVYPWRRSTKRSVQNEKEAKFKEGSRFYYVKKWKHRICLV